jgi:DNA primase large subunit
VLKKIEQLKMMRVSPDKYEETLNKVIDEQGLTKEQVDESSHFILRLCYCQSEELRRWFLQHEALLFQFRLNQMKNRGTKKLARAVRAYCQVQPITEEEKKQHEEALRKLLVNPSEYKDSRFYSVPFTQVLDLVSQRQCYLWRGQAYIPEKKVESLLVSKFRAELSRTLASMAAHHVLDVDTAANDPEAGRLVPLVANLNRCLVTEEPGVSDTALAGTALTAGNVTQHVPYMPLCMRELQTGLQKDKKLKHWGRLQYGLFLKVRLT